MARTYLVFGDIEGKLDVLRVECTKCARKGRYSVRRLIEKYGRKANMMKWREQLNGKAIHDSFCSRLCQPFRARCNPALGLCDQVCRGGPEDWCTYDI